MAPLKDPNKLKLTSSETVNASNAPMFPAMGSTSDLTRNAWNEAIEAAAERVSQEYFEVIREADAIAARIRDLKK